MEFPQRLGESDQQWLRRAIATGQNPAVIAGITTLVQSQGKMSHILCNLVFIPQLM